MLLQEREVGKGVELDKSFTIKILEEDDVDPTKEDIDKSDIILISGLKSSLNNLITAKLTDHAIKNKKTNKKTGIEWGNTPKFKDEIEEIIDSSDNKMIVCSPLIAAMITSKYDIEVNPESNISGEDSTTNLYLGEIKEKNIILLRDILTNTEYMIVCENFDPEKSLIEYTYSLETEEKPDIGFIYYMRKINYGYTEFNPTSLNPQLYVFM